MSDIKIKERRVIEMTIGPNTTAWDLYEATGDIHSEAKVEIVDGVLKFYETD